MFLASRRRALVPRRPLGRAPSAGGTIARRQRGRQGCVSRSCPPARPALSWTGPGGPSALARPRRSTGVRKLPSASYIIYTLLDKTSTRGFICFSRCGSSQAGTFSSSLWQRGLFGEALSGRRGCSWSMFCRCRPPTSADLFVVPDGRPQGNMHTALYSTMLVLFVGLLVGWPRKPQVG
jgi:hypothetical protein